MDGHFLLIVGQFPFVDSPALLYDSEFMVVKNTEGL